ncbi:Mu transposase domain-containing protein [Saccharothrix syringae]|uniref:Mu transposase domain-containing protein n=1 Tax=Saccharothrix syringae TaxID=103733 RepID=UPI000A908581|nr:hypothetical protein [Saccharothrix syringae]
MLGGMPHWSIDPCYCQPGERGAHEKGGVEAGRWFTPRVDRYAQVTVRTNRYSVPVRLIG